MRLITKFFLMSTLLLTGCLPRETNPEDPFESINRKTHRFNMGFDYFILKPAAITYKTLVPSLIRTGIDNVYNNVNMLPTVANDLLQTEWHYAIKDAWRFIANSTLGVAGIFDVATHCSLPPHSNDLGLTFAKWGNQKSPYIVIPLLGPSTIRDGFGMMFDYAFFTPYPYIRSNAVMYSILGIRYVDLRSQMLETDALFGEALDKYAFIRDAYLQHRSYLITGTAAQPNASDSDSLYVDEEGDSDKSSKTTEPAANGKPSPFPLTTAMNSPTKNIHGT